MADRTGFWLKEQRQFEPWSFGCLLLASLAVGLATVKRADKDMGFLNRDQTDEWKGWMQSKHLIDYCYFRSCSFKQLSSFFIIITGDRQSLAFITQCEYS